MVDQVACLFPQKLPESDFLVRVTVLYFSCIHTLESHLQTSEFAEAQWTEYKKDLVKKEGIKAAGDLLLKFKVPMAVINGALSDQLERTSGVSKVLLVLSDSTLDGNYPCSDL